MFKKFRKHWKLLNKIESQLPRYHPETGERLNWDVELGHYKNLRFDSRTGKPTERVFVPKIRIEQTAPNRCGSPVYYFDWYKKEIVARQGCKWGH